MLSFCMACLSPVTTAAISVLLLPDRLKKSYGQANQADNLQKIRHSAALQDA